jgi:hypothetical protein
MSILEHSDELNASFPWSFWKVYFIFDHKQWNFLAIFFYWNYNVSDVAQWVYWSASGPFPSGMGSIPGGDENFLSEHPQKYNKYKCLRGW